MRLIFIYGPPASGKLTIANVIAEKTGYKVFHNHQVLDMLTPLFPYRDEVKAPIRQTLSRRIRLDIFKTAAEARVDVVTTFGSAGEEYFDFYHNTKQLVEEAGGEVCFVQLTPSKDVLAVRSESETRASAKMRTAQEVAAWLERHPEAYDKFSEVEHPTIDNSELSAEEVAQQIIEYYKLPIL